MTTATASPAIVAGIPATNMMLLHRAGFRCGDPAAWLRLPDGSTHFIVRDIELARARREARTDRCHAPVDFQPLGFDGGALSADRELATAQAAAECLRRAGVSVATADRTLPLIYAETLRRAGIEVRLDTAFGVDDRRRKTEAEIDALRRVQAVTEAAIRSACELIASAVPDRDGVLQADGGPLTPDRVRIHINALLMRSGCSVDQWIIAGGPDGADCHDRGHAPLRTGEPVIIDVFPRDLVTGYHGDCTRTVVHGEVSDELARMHETVVAAKAAATAAVRTGVSCAQVHRATLGIITASGFTRALPPEGVGREFCSMQHGTGHGIGLDVHEAPLLDDTGAGPSPELVAGDALTIEPGLYRPGVGGVRVEDMVIVTDSGCLNLNTLPEGLRWA